MITVQYSCPECGLKDVPVQVPAREDPDENAVVPWMHEQVIPSVTADHDKRSPKCHPKELKDLKIPLPPGSEFVGQQIE